jgi:hypothetical protein
MRHTQRASTELDQTLARLAAEPVIELELDDLADLLVEPDVAPFQARRSPHRAGIEELVLTLAAAERLPDELTVRVILPADRSAGVPIEHAQSALRARAADLTNESWREAMAIRSMGRRQLPLGIGIGIGAALAAYVAAFFATVVDTPAARGALVVAAAIALTVAWVVGWVVVEAAILDWRLPARRAAACELLESATLEISYGGSSAQVHDD